MNISELLPTEYNPYYKKYIELAGNNNLIDGLQISLDRSISFFKLIPSEKLEYRYAENKWTIKEIIQHLIDTERVFSYRALRFARQDKTALPGYDQDAYVNPSQANSRTLVSLQEEYINVRSATVSLFNGLSDKMLIGLGEASGSSMSSRACGFIIIGHETHHCQIIKRRYL